MKFSATRVFDGFSFLPAGFVVITDDDGVILDIVRQEIAGDDVQEYNGILAPGFINCHCHLELGHMKGVIPRGTGMAEFLSSVLNLRNFSPEKIKEGIEKAEDEMYANGIVAVGDICNTAYTIPQKLKGRIWYHNFIEVLGLNDEIAAERFKRSVEVFMAFAQLYSIPIESNSIVPHAPYSVSDTLWKYILQYPGNHLFSIHNQESVEEEEWMRSKTGLFGKLFEGIGVDLSSVTTSGQPGPKGYLPQMLRNQSIILVHNVETKEEDVKAAIESGLDVSWCLCPNANEYITGNLPDLNLLVRNDCHIVLGTDSLASNDRLDILSEIKTLRSHFPEIAVDQLLRWATSNGARSLRMENLLGSFEKGKRPGLLLLENDLSGVQRLK